MLESVSGRVHRERLIGTCPIRVRRSGPVELGRLSRLRVTSVRRLANGDLCVQVRRRTRTLKDWLLLLLLLLL